MKQKSKSEITQINSIMMHPKAFKKWKATKFPNAGSIVASIASFQTPE